SIADAVDVRRLLGQKRGKMESRAHRNHQLEFARDCCQGGGSRPGVERRRVNALNVVKIEFGDERQSIANLLASTGQTADVIPGRRHAFVFDIAQPSAKYW